ncbi:MAG: hypothetical protein JO103_11755, partial [Candidatus Eremiobacteraeota bacterium]|nr:hypothetical protein [Candidatus Eremiobacteraeota bacterium]
NSVCPDCAAARQRAADAAGDPELKARYDYEKALANGPHYAGDPEAWTPRDPVLLPDREHFVCPGCKRRAHLVHDLSIRWNKKPYPIPNKYSLCDACHRRDVEDGGTPVYTNRFNRER